MILEGIDMTKRCYFAYGSNMSVAEMQWRCPGALLLETARLDAHRFVINARGVATVTPDPAGAVYGVLWQITVDHEEALDLYEGVRLGFYKKRTKGVMNLEGRQTKALIYTATDSTPGRPRDGYLEEILSAAKGHGFPSSYIKELEKWLRAGAPHS